VLEVTTPRSDESSGSELAGVAQDGIGFREDKTAIGEVTSDCGQTQLQSFSFPAKFAGIVLQLDEPLWRIL